MKTKFLLTLIASFIALSVCSQSKLNKYKYIIVPEKFDFLKEKDQYQLNSLAQFLFDKAGFQTLKEGGEYPEDLLRDRCLALKSEAIKESGIFSTKLRIQFKDCNDQIVYTSERGDSREKEYKRAYVEALRKAFKSVEALNYKYEPSLSTKTNSSEKIEVSNEVEKLKQEIATLKQEKEIQVVEKVESQIKKEAESVKDITNNIKATAGVLYAQQIENGFQLVDNTPKVVYRIKKTGLNNVFLVEGKEAILYKKSEKWIMEYYINNNLQQEVLNLKF